MKPSDAIATLRAFNAWRRDDGDIDQPDPREIGLAIDALCNHAERMERELTELRKNGSALIASLQAELDGVERELEQERQDRKQADLDTIRALGERNDARKEIERDENAKAIQSLSVPERFRLMFGRFFVPGESCPECGNDLAIRDNRDGKVYDGDECRCCGCGFAGYISVDEDGDMTINGYELAETDDQAGG